MHYPAAWGALFGIVALLAVVAVLVMARRRRRLRVRNMAMGFAAAIAPVFLAVLLGAIAAGLYERGYPDPDRTLGELAEYLLPSSAPLVIVPMVLTGIVPTLGASPGSGNHQPAMCAERAGVDAGPLADLGEREAF